LLGLWSVSLRLLRGVLGEGVHGCVQ